MVARGTLVLLPTPPNFVLGIVRFGRVLRGDVSAAICGWIADRGPWR